MGLGLSRVQRGFDGFLRVQDVDSKSDAIHVRAVGIGCLVFAVFQTLNLALLSLKYGKFTSHQTISLSAIGLALAAFVMLRYVKKSAVFAVILAIGIVLAVLATAVPSQLGIHTATLPYLVMGVVASAFIGKWYYNFSFSICALAVIWGLYYMSMNAPIPHNIPPDMYAIQVFQRASQSSLAVIMSSCIVGCYMYMTNRNFESLEALEARLNKSEQARFEVLANISHEMRTPLNGIVGLSDMLARADLPKKQAKLAKIIYENSEEVSALIDTIVAYSQTDSGEVVFSDHPFEIRDMVNRIVDRHKQLAGDKDIVFTVHISDSVATTYRGDILRISQIINAVFDNAVKFTRDGVISIFVTTRFLDGQDAINFRVKDTGIGIPREYLQSIFDRFTQVDSGLKREYSGVGLGLTTAQRMCELMGGEITVGSKFGQGSEFTITIPAIVHEFGNAQAELRVA